MFQSDGCSDDACTRPSGWGSDLASNAATLLKKITDRRTEGLLTLLLAVSLAPLLGQNSSTGSSSKVQAEKIYAVQCAICHGADAHGGQYGPALAGHNDLREKSISWIHDVIKNGIPAGGMPAFKLAPEELDALAAFVRSLNVTGDPKHGAGKPGRGRTIFLRPWESAPPATWWTAEEQRQVLICRILPATGRSRKFEDLY